MQDLLVLVPMVLCAMVPLFGLAIAVRAGKSGLALSVIVALGGLLSILIYAAGNPIGLDPIQAMAWALIFALPALLGAVAGGLLGRMLRLKDDRKAARK